MRAEGSLQIKTKVSMNVKSTERFSVRADLVNSTYADKQREYGHTFCSVTTFWVPWQGVILEYTWLLNYGRLDFVASTPE